MKIIVIGGNERRRHTSNDPIRGMVGALKGRDRLAVTGEAASPVQGSTFTTHVRNEPAVPEETSGGRTAVDMDAPTDWSDGGADETTGWVGMHGWYY